MLIESRIERRGQPPFAGVDPHAAAAFRAGSAASAAPGALVRSALTGLSIRRILAPLDGSPLAETGLRHAAALAHAFGAQVVLLRVLEGSPRAGSEAPVDALDWELRRVESRAYLARIEEEFRGRGVEVGSEIVQGRAAERILEQAAAGHSDLIVIPSHGERGAGPWRLGSTTEKVLAAARTSVLLVPARSTDESDLRFRRLLVPLDCSLRAECILPAARSLARPHGAELVLVHVVGEPDLPRRVAASTEDRRLADELTERNRVEARRYLDEIASRLTALGERVEVRVCVAVDRTRALMEIADDEDVDLVVLSAHGSTGDPTRTSGSLTGRLLHEAYLPVLVLQDFADAMRDPA